MHHTKRTGGFTIIELLIVVTVISIIAIMAIPKYQSSKLSANELSAIATLKALQQAQHQVQSSGSIDTDSDGAAEFAYMAELTGAMPLRVSVGGVPAAGAVGANELNPPALTATLGQVQNSLVVKSGYMFQVYLPSTPAAGAVPAIPEDPNGGKVIAPFPDANGCEVYWCAYAWPIAARKTGTPVFFVNQEGEIFESPNRGAGAYQGLAGAPAFDAAFTLPGSMASPVAGLVGGIANDGNIWVPVK